MTEVLAAKAVALATGVSTDTLRHYERKGLLPRVHRTASGHRRYSPATIERVLLIQRALVVGFSLNDLGRVLAVRDRGGAPCHTVRALVNERLDALARQIQDLAKLRDELRVLVSDWDAILSKTPVEKPARLLDTLATSATVERARCKRSDRVEQTRLSHLRSGRLRK
jgi:DNA-binding transcriptional MerR regulator